MVTIDTTYLFGVMLPQIGHKKTRCSIIYKERSRYMKKWRCKICGYVHEGDSPPEECPICGASKDQFEEVTD